MGILNVENLNQNQVDAKKAFEGGYNCAESVSKIVATHFDLDAKSITGIATGFGGGISRHGLTCGALTGGVISISAVINNNFRKSHDSAIKKKITEKVQTLFKEFEKEFGSINCRELTNCNFLEESGLKKFREQQIQNNVCEHLVTWSVKKTIELLEK